MNEEATQGSPVPGSLAIAIWMEDEGEPWPVSGDDLHTNRSGARKVFVHYMKSTGKAA